MTLNLDMKGIDCVTLTPDTASELRKVPPWPVQYVKIEKKKKKWIRTLLYWLSWLVNLFYKHFIFFRSDHLAEPFSLDIENGEVSIKVFDGW